MQSACQFVLRVAPRTVSRVLNNRRQIVYEHLDARRLVASKGNSRLSIWQESRRRGWTEGLVRSTADKLV